MAQKKVTTRMMNPMEAFQSAAKIIQKRSAKKAGAMKAKYKAFKDRPNNSNYYR